MKKLIGIIALATISMGAFAQEGIKMHDSTGAYLMMTHGKMIEVFNGHKKQVYKNVTLVNGTTIHPSGIINVSSGKTKKLKNGQYITMDGHILNLKNMPHVTAMNP